MSLTQGVDNLLPGGLMWPSQAFYDVRGNGKKYLATEENYGQKVEENMKVRYIL
jgi:hypothetical protein